MSRKRSSYRPKQVRLDIVHLAMLGASRLDMLTKNTRRIEAEKALSAIANGDFSRQYRLTMAAVFNITEQLLKSGLAKHSRAWLAEMEESIGMAMIGCREGRKPSEDELDSMRALMLTYSDLLDVITVRELHEAREAAERKTLSALDGHGDGVVMLEIDA